MTFEPATEPPSDASDRVWFVIAPSGLVVRQDGERAVLPGESEEQALGLDRESALFLGTLGGRPAFAASLAEGATLPDGLAAVGLRGLLGALGEEAWGVAGRAAQLCEWRATHRFCGRCATPTTLVKGERCLRCPACGLTAYPRIAPAIIVLIRRGDEALLARGVRFAAPMYSTLAGFVEPGETLEETLAREVHEEVGIRVTNPRYFGSQSWPFPHSLMVGFTADWASGEIAVDPREIMDAKWFKASDELPRIPPPPSIARRLIDAWLAEVRGEANDGEFDASLR